MFNRLQNLIDAIPSGLRRVLIAVVVLALLAIFFPLRENSTRQTMPPPISTPTPSPRPTQDASTGSQGSDAPAATVSSGQNVVTPTPRPSSTPQPTATVCTPDPDWVIYTVRPGDTLNGIAGLVGATIRELVEGNCLLNPNLLRVGQQVFVPSLPSAFVTSTATPSITPTLSATATIRP